MRIRQAIKAQVPRLFHLGLPLIGSHLAQFTLSLTDTIMLGRYNLTDLAGQILGSTLFFVLFLMGSGFAWAITPLVAAALDDKIRVRRITRMALWITLGVSLLALPILLNAEAILIAARQDPELAALARDYLAIAGPAIVPALLMMTLRSYLAALEHVRIVMVVSVVAVLANAGLNYLFIFGNLGMPELGLHGAALASLVVTAGSLLWLIVYIHRKIPEHTLFSRLWKPDYGALVEVFRLGWPIGLTSLAETGLFSASTLMMGWLGTLPLAAHGIALQITSAVFMFHVGLSNAATIRGGQAFGRKDKDTFSQIVKAGLALAIAAAILTAIIFLIIPDILNGLFIDRDDPQRADVLAIGRTLLGAAAIFQIVDATQIMVLSLLRSLQDTRVPMMLAVASYWLIGVPCSWLFGFIFGLEGVGVWLGLAIGLCIAALTMLARLLRVRGPRFM